MLVSIICFHTYSRFHIVFSCIEQLQLHKTNSDKLFSFLFSYNYFLIFLVMAFSIHPSFKNVHLISKYMGFKNIFDINFSFKCFLLYNLCFFNLLALLRLSMTKSNVSLGKCHVALENMWAIFKYLLILISNIMPQL